MPRPTSCGPEEDRQWNQTIIEFSHGWSFLIGAGQGAYLAAAAAPDVDMQQISFRMQRLVARLGNNLTSPPRLKPEADAGARHTPAPRPEGRRDSGFVLPELDRVVDEVRGPGTPCCSGPTVCPAARPAG